MSNPGAIGSQTPLASITATTEQLPEAIHIVLRRSGKSQRQFAKDAGYNEAFVSRVLTGKRTMTLEFVKNAQRALGLRIVLTPGRDQKGSAT